FNAFLKTLEEPPRHAIFILATTEKHKILPTILSRCQIYDFNRISVDDMVAHLAYVASKEGITAEPEALNVIALKADGGMRDALSIFDQVVSFTGGHITYEKVIENLNVLDYEYYFRLTDCFLENRVTDALLLFDEVLGKGFEGGHFITGLASHLRDLLVSKDAATLPLLEVGAGIRERYKAQAGRCPLPFLYQAMKLCNTCDLNYRASKNKRLLVELALIEAAQITAHLPAPAQAATAPAAATQPASTTKTASTAKAAPAASKAAPTVSKASPATQAAPTASLPNNDTAAPPHQAPAILKEAEDHAVKRPPTLKRGSMGISIKGVVSGGSDLPTRQTTEAVPKEARPSTPEEAASDEAVSEEALNRCWRAYAATMPQEQVALAKRMGKMPVHLTDDTTFEVVVDNEFAAKAFTALIPQVQDYLRQQLNNSRLAMKVRVSEETTPTRAYTRAEKYQLMAGKNEALLQFKDRFGLEFY
ncbi:MAG: DNA polymerase III subunit gamma/tau, partial [Prevotellaceae bacterium]|nr:DNA polymerase III subunit gamma/tau [Prevotellaceae bacterium]